MLELRCNIAPDETYFYTKHIVMRAGGVWSAERWGGREFERLDAYTKLAGITIKIDFKPHV
jgi:hypothetical protein